MALRVIQWATGGVGRAAIEGVLAHPDLEVAGCWVHSTEKDGRDIGTLAGTDPIGIAATSDIDALLAVDADCVVYSPFMADPRVVTRILESGKNVVTPLGWFYPPSDDRQRMDTVARDAGKDLRWRPVAQASTEAPPWEKLLTEPEENEDEDLIQKAISIVRQSQRASASLLQRRLRIGYPRAARLLDQLEEMDVVGPSQGGGKERDVLIGPLDADEAESIQ